MDYNLAALRQRVLVDKLDDDEFDPGVVDRFINDTIRNIWNQFELPFQEKIFQGSIPVGSTIFQLPSDLAQLQSQSLTGVKNFSSMKMAWRDFFALYPDPTSEDAGEPARWTLYAGNVIFNRPTDRAYTLTSFYIKKPTVLVNDSSVPELPVEFSEAIILGALKRIHDRNEDTDLSDKIEIQYQTELQLLVDRYGFREASGPIIMRNRQIRT